MSCALLSFRVINRYLSKPRLAVQLGGMALAAGLLLLPMAAKADLTLTFGTYAADKPTETVRKYRPFLSFLADRMSDELGERVTIKMKISKEYEAGIKQLADGGVDFARFGPASYVHVVEKNPDIQLVMACGSPLWRSRMACILGETAFILAMLR